MPDVKQGVDCLRSYRRDYDERRSVYFDKPLHDWASHGCLTGETMIEMSDGQKRLDQVKVGDYVKLNSIHARVDAAEFTGIKDVIEIEFTDGTKIQATPEHKFLTVNGMVFADALRYSTQILTEELIPCNSILAKMGVRNYLSTNAKSLMAEDSMSGRTTGITLLNILSRVLCTDMFGSITTVKYLKGIISTIKMELSPITTYLTLCAYQTQSTASITQKQMRGSVQKQTSNNLLKLGKKQKSGTVQKQEESGTVSVERNHGKIVMSMMQPVRFVESFFKRRIQPEQNSAIKTVKRITAVGKKPTFDLTVNHHHAYIANGVVVSNSDAFRYLATGINDTSSWAKPLKVNTGWVV
jgi:hypothetical protein